MTKGPGSPRLAAVQPKLSLDLRTHSFLSRDNETFHAKLSDLCHGTSLRGRELPRPPRPQLSPETARVGTRFLMVGTRPSRTPSSPGAGAAEGDRAAGAGWHLPASLQRERSPGRPRGTGARGGRGATAPHTPAHFQGAGASCRRPGPRSQTVCPELAQTSETAHPLRDSGELRDMAPGTPHAAGLGRDCAAPTPGDLGPPGGPELPRAHCLPPALPSLFPSSLCFLSFISMFCSLRCNLHTAKLKCEGSKGSFINPDKHAA